MLNAVQTKTALQAMLDAKYGAGKYTVADGLAFICGALDLEPARLSAIQAAANSDTQSVFAGTLHLACIHAEQPAQVEITGNPAMSQAEGIQPAIVAASAVIRVQQAVSFQDIVFGYIDGARFDGIFTGFKFEVSTVFVLNENGTLALGENGQPYEGE